MHDEQSYGKSYSMDCRVVYIPLFEYAWFPEEDTNIFKVMAIISVEIASINEHLE